MELLRQALAAGWLDADDTAVVLYDMDLLAARFDSLCRAFPQGTLHAVAVKACPLPPLVGMLAAMGAGAEVASLPELRLALAAGVPAERIVFDSPAKTVAELREALLAGIWINADNEDELERLDVLAGETGCVPRAGLRINPQAGQGRIKATSVAGRYSKFGVPLAAHGRILGAFARYPWLMGLHVHVGSQGCPLDMLVAGGGAVYDLALEINAIHGPGRVARFDLGGGLPVAYRDADTPPSPADYVAALLRRAPDLGRGAFGLVTEFGRKLFAPCALAASRVEYIKRQPGHRTAVLHLGADMFVRECYNPRNWPHRSALAGPDGSPKTGRQRIWHLAGPLCFSGDFPVWGASLPDIAVGDWVGIRDAGAYTLAMWSRYNSRQMPLVLGWRQGGFTVLRRRERPEDVLDFWNGPGPA